MLFDPALLIFIYNSLLFSNSISFSVSSSVPQWDWRWNNRSHFLPGPELSGRPGALPWFLADLDLSNNSLQSLGPAFSLRPCSLYLSVYHLYSFYENLNLLPILFPYLSLSLSLSLSICISICISISFSVFSLYLYGGYLSISLLLFNSTCFSVSIFFTQYFIFCSLSLHFYLSLFQSRSFPFYF